MLLKCIEISVFKILKKNHSNIYFQDILIKYLNTHINNKKKIFKTDYILVY